MALLGARSIAGWIYDSISFTVAQQKNLSTNFPDSFDVSQRLISLMIESPMITDTFLFFEFLPLLLMLFCLFELVTIFFLLFTFQVVISCFGVLSLLCFRLNFSEFLRIFVTEMSLLLFVNAENWFDEAVPWSGMVITWSSAYLFVMSLLLWVSVENLSRSEILITWSPACLSVILFFLTSSFLLFSVRLVMFWKSSWFSISAWKLFFVFFFLGEYEKSVLKVRWYIENFVRDKYLTLVMLTLLKEPSVLI